MDSTRPLIQVRCDDDQTLHCLHCEKLLSVEDVANLSRTKKESIFDAWCVDCWLTLVTAARVGMETAIVYVT